MKKNVVFVTLLGLLQILASHLSAMKSVKIVKRNTSYLEDSRFANPILLKRRVLAAIHKNQVNNIRITLEDATLRKKLFPLKNVMLHLALDAGHIKIVFLILNTYPTAIQHINQEDLKTCVMNATLKNKYTSIKLLLNNSTLKDRIEPLLKDIICVATEEKHFELQALIIKHFPEAKEYITQEDINNLIAYAITNKKEGLACTLFDKKTILAYAFWTNNQNLVSSLLKEQCAENAKTCINHVTQNIKFMNSIRKKVKRTHTCFLEKTESTILDLLKTMPLQDVLNAFASQPDDFKYFIRYIVENITDQKTLEKTFVFAVQKNHYYLIKKLLLLKRPLMLGESLLRQVLTFTEELTPIHMAIRIYLDEHFPTFFQKLIEYASN